MKICVNRIPDISLQKRFEFFDQESLYTILISFNIALSPFIGCLYKKRVATVSQWLRRVHCYPSYGRIFDFCSIPIQFQILGKTQHKTITPLHLLIFNQLVLSKILREYDLGLRCRCATHYPIKRAISLLLITIAQKPPIQFTSQLGNLHV